ncbi:MAG: hypothetical protein ACE5FI_14555, partial [Anaerolineales bacterium]
ALFATAITAPSVGLAVGLVVGLIRGVIAFATADANAPGLALSVGLGIAVVFTSGVGLVSLLHYGLLDVVKHYTLRVLLWRAGSVPGNVADFLDHAVELIFLRRVGDGYIFIHRLLLEYFASLPETGSPPAA